MPVNRYFSDSFFSLGQQVVLMEEEAHHLIHVMRSKVGEKVELVNGKWQLAQGILHSIEKRRATLAIVEIENRNPSSQEFILLQALPRFHHLESLLEKATTLGMTSLFLFIGERSERKELSEKQKSRMESILKNAVKQCGRLDLPHLSFKPPLTQWSSSDLLFPTFYGDPQGGGAPLFSHCGGGICFCNGPEAGFSENEKTILQKLNVKGVKLHPNILRTETAPLVFLSLATHLLHHPFIDDSGLGI